MRASGHPDMSSRWPLAVRSSLGAVSGHVAARGVALVRSVGPPTSGRQAVMPRFDESVDIPTKSGSTLSIQGGGDEITGVLRATQREANVDIPRLHTPGERSHVNSVSVNHQAGAGVRADPGDPRAVLGTHRLDED